MLVISAATDKLASNIRNNAATGVIVFGIIMGNYALMGQFNLVVLIPGIIFTFIGTSYAKRVGQKKSFAFTTATYMLAYIGIILLFIFGDPIAILLTDWNINTIIFVVLFVIEGNSPK